jgi:hypothetical protein
MLLGLHHAASCCFYFRFFPRTAGFAVFCAHAVLLPIDGEGQGMRFAVRPPPPSVCSVRGLRAVAAGPTGGGPCCPDTLVILPLWDLPAPGAPLMLPPLLARCAGCSINPARSLGPAIVSGTWPGTFWVFVVGPFVGALFAVPFHLFFDSDWVGAGGQKAIMQVLLPEGARTLGDPLRCCGARVAAGPALPGRGARRRRALRRVAPLFPAPCAGLPGSEDPRGSGCRTEPHFQPA